jgi:integrase
MSDELHEIMKIHFEWKNSISVDTPFTFFIPGTTNLSIDQTGHPRKNNFRREILAGANRAGVKTEGVNVKCLRLSRASELLTRSIEDSIESSQAMLGHADPYITKRHYIKPTFEFFDKLREKLNKNQYDFNLAHLRNVLEIPDPASNSLRAETMK